MKTLILVVVILILALSAFAEHDLEFSKALSFSNISLYSQNNLSDKKEYTISNKLAGFDGSFDLIKSVDSDRDGFFDDENKSVKANDILTYKIDWKFNQEMDPLDDAYVYDTIPNGTTYIGGTASPTNNLSYSLDNGLTWVNGDAPHASPAGTIFRWGKILPYWANMKGDSFTASPDNAVFSPKSVQPSLVIDKNDTVHATCPDYAKSDLEYDIIEAKWD